MSFSPMPRCLITAGPTHEPLDPVRYLGNRSSGKMGHALAAAAAEAGAEVVLVSGPVALDPPNGLVEVVRVGTAAEMAAAVQECLDGLDIVVCAAAVADWTPVQVAAQKIKKDGLGRHWTIALERTTDILGSLRGWGFEGTLVGFAAETECLEEHARVKLEAKDCDLVVANDVSRADIGFGSEDNEVLLVSAGGSERLPRASKVELAREIWQRIAQLAPGS